MAHSHLTTGCIVALLALLGCGRGQASVFRAFSGGLVFRWGPAQRVLGFAHPPLLQLALIVDRGDTWALFLPGGEGPVGAAGLAGRPVKVDCIFLC